MVVVLLLCCRFVSFPNGRMNSIFDPRLRRRDEWDGGRRGWCRLMYVGMGAGGVDSVSHSPRTTVPVQGQGMIAFGEHSEVRLTADSGFPQACPMEGSAPQMVAGLEVQEDEAGAPVQPHATNALRPVASGASLLGVFPTYALPVRNRVNPILPPANDSQEAVPGDETGDEIEEETMFDEL